MTRKRIVILGGGTGGTMTANRLRRRFDRDEAEIHVVDRDDTHVYQPGLLFVPFGLAQVGEIVRPRRRQLRDGVVFHENEVESVALDKDEPKVHAHVVIGLSDGEARGGHLLEAHVWPTLEVILVESPRHLRKRHDPETGLALIDPAA